MNFIRQFYRLVRPQLTLLALTIGCGFLFIVERGTHQDLLARAGCYARMI